MTIATVERLMNLRRGWRLQMFQPARDISLRGEVTEVTENGFRLGVDDDSTHEPGKSLWFDHDKVVHDHWDVTVIDRSGELEVEVVVDSDRGPWPELEQLSHEDPVQSVPSNTTMVERPEGYDQSDSDVALSLAGARQDDAAIADAERDRDDATMSRLIVTIHLPLPLGKVGEILAMLGTHFPSSYLREGGPESEMRVYAREEET